MKTLMALLAVSLVLVVSVRAQAMPLDERQVNPEAAIFYVTQDDAAVLESARDLPGDKELIESSEEESEDI